MVHDDFLKSTSGETSKDLFEGAVSSQWFKDLDLKLKETKYKKGQLLLSVGQTSDSIVFIQVGSIRAYYYDSNNKQQTFYLWDQYSIVTDILNQLDEVPTDLYFEVSEDTTTLMIDKFPFEKILSDSPNSMQFLFKLVLQYARHHREREKQFLTSTSEERFGNLVRKRKNLEQIFQWGFIASYLGISRSRLYGLMKKKNR